MFLTAPRITIALSALLILTSSAVSSGTEAPPTEARSPAEELKTFRLAPGFRVELVAAEPEVADPVSMAWDERGRMWITEMGDYPRGAPAGKVRLLEDRDHDGRYQRSSVFAEGLPYPTSALPWKKGLLVAAAPDILYLEDTDGDGRADVRRVVLTGFAEGNQQLRVNGLLRGLDGRVHGANGRSGGKARRPGDPPANGVNIDGRDFRFDLESFAVESAAGPSQFGHAFDVWGRRFLSWNTIHIRQEMLSPRDLERHPLLLRTATVVSISNHGDSARVYPIAPPPRTFNDEPTDHFNAGCGLTVEKGGIFPPEYAGCAYACEPLTGLVHRDRLVQGPGAPLVGERGAGEGESEFLASADPWFHPVNLRSGPDGALYVADFYREMVEHPDFVHGPARDAVDFGRGHGHGRIWRIVPEGNALLPVEELSALPAAGLVERLRSLNGPVRETAQRLIVDGAMKEAVASLLALANGAKEQPLARLHAFWTLHGLAALPEEPLRAALEGDNDRLRETALRILREERRAIGGWPGIILARRQERYRDPQACYQAVLALGEIPIEASAEKELFLFLTDALRRFPGDPWFETAILIALRGREARYLESRARLLVLGVLPLGILREIAELAGAGDRDSAGKVLEVCRRTFEVSLPSAALAMAAGLARGLERAGMPAAEVVKSGGILGAALGAALGAVWKDQFERARGIAESASAEADLRSAAASLLAYAPLEISGKTLAGLLVPALPPDLQKAGARALGARGLDGDGTAAALLSAWPGSTPAVRKVLLESLLAGSIRKRALLAAIEEGRIAPRDLDPAQREAVLRAADPAVKKKLEELLRPGGGDRSAIVDRYRKEAPPQGDAARGKELFAKNCATCHRNAGQGVAVGPDLDGVGAKGREEIIVSLLDPSRSVVAGYTLYAALKSSGEAVSGVIAGETASAITLRWAEGREETIPRAALRSLTSTGASLMPENLETALTPEAMADLLEFLKANEKKK